MSNIMRAAAGGIAVAVVALGCASHTTSGRPAAANPLVVPCSNIIDSVRASGAGGYREVLGTVSVPPAFLQKPAASADPSWPYFSKSGLVVHAGLAPVTVTVPSTWRARVAISWGNGLAVVSKLRITGCPPSPKPWNAYAGGFYTRSSSACVPLTFQIGARSQTVRFGLGRRCDAHG